MTHKNIQPTNKIPLKSLPTLFYFLAIYAFTGFSSVLGQGVDCGEKTDREILIELADRNAVKTGDEYQFGNGVIWDLLKEPKEWPGVTVDELNEANVKELSLNGFELTSKLPVSLGCLEDLELLDLSGNSLRDTIPASFGQMRNLTYMNISDNQLSGKIPNAIFENLNKLTYLNLSNNWKRDIDVDSGLTGQIPVTLNVNSLIELRLANNRLEGRMPNGLGFIQSLKVIDFSDSEGLDRTEGNKLSSLPAQINWPELEEIKINNNDLEGGIPTELWNSKKLRLVDLSRNRLNGELPVILTGLNRLNLLYLYKNNLSGNLPELDTDTNGISDFNLSDNQFEGSLPASYGLLDKLVNLLLNKNLLEDISQVDFSLLTALEELNISDNEIEDLPPNWQLPAALTDLRLQSNKFTFEDFLPNIAAIISKNGIYAPQDSVGVESIINLAIGQNANISYNVDANLPVGNPATYSWFKDGAAAGIADTEISEITINNTQVADEGVYNFESTHPDVPNLVLNSKPVTLRINTPCEEDDRVVITSLYNSTDGVNWARPWELKDELNTLEGITTDEATGCIVKLEIDNQALNGIIPDDIGNIANLEKLLFTRNPNLAGTVPGGISALANLEEMVISSTGINNFEASTITPLTNLRILRLKDNQLNELPNLTGMTQLEVFEVDLNQLTFEDIIPNLGVLTSYAPQDSIGNADNPILNIGGNYTYNMPVFDQGLDNKYQWFKDDVPLVNTPDLELANLQLADAGVYYCIIKNDQVPDLELVSRKITLEVREDCTETDYNALKEIYDNTDGLNWIWNDPLKAWDFSDPANKDISNWEGVRVNTQGCAVGLELKNKGLNGQLPEALGDLINLDTLEISGNINLVGKIPNTIGLLSNLVHLDLAANRLTDVIPASLGDLRSLIYLALNNNDLQGALPQSIGQLTALKKLIISNNVVNGNGLSGEIPVSIGELIALDTLIAGQNKFTGAIPNEIGTLTNLKLLDLSDNQLAGEIPQGLFNLTNLEVLNLSINKFDGNIPAGLGTLPLLKELSLRNNQFTGTLPASITTLPLTRLLVNNNLLENIGDVSALPLTAFVNVSGNKLTFNDILDYTTLLDSYAPQDSVGEAQVQALVVGQTYTFDLNIDNEITNSTYTWKKDGVIIDVTNQNSYTIADVVIEDAGVYTCEVTNTGADELTLISRNFVLTVDGSGGGGGNDLEIIGDSLVCISSLKVYEVLNSSANVTWSLNPAQAGQIFAQNQAKTDILWVGTGEIELTFTDNESEESITKIITVVDAFAPPAVDFKPVVVIDQPFEDITAMGAPNAQFFWYFNGEEIATGEIFNPGNVGVNGFSNADAGFYDFEVVQQGAGGNCRSEPRAFRVRIVEESLPAPNDLIAINQNNEAVKLEWTFSQPAVADSVVIERSITGTENFEVIAIVAYDGVNEYIDNLTLEEGVVYNYRIRMADFENDQVSPYSNIAAVTVNGSVDMNNPPAVADINKSGKAGLEITFLISDFINAFSDPDNDTLVSITILTLPENGTILLGNNPIAQNQVFNKDELDGLVFIADEGFFGETTFTYTASDGEDNAATAANVIINITETVLPESADLIVSASANPLEVSLGGEISFSISLLNSGESVARDFTLSVFLSQDSLISADDVPVFNVTLDSLAPAENLTQEQLLSIPPDFLPGTYVVIFFIDANRNVEEINEENNLAFIEIIITETLEAPVIPNIITPNGDLVNDFLEIENIAQYPENTLTVLDKWGNVVFETTNYQNNWAGTDSAGQVLPAGNYMLIFTVAGDNAATYTEVLTLIK